MVCLTGCFEIVLIVDRVLLATCVFLSCVLGFCRNWTKPYFEDSRGGSLFRCLTPRLGGHSCLTSWESTSLPYRGEGLGLLVVALSLKIVGWSCEVWHVYSGLLVAVIFSVETCLVRFVAIFFVLEACS